LPAYGRGGWRAVEFWLTKLESYLEGHTIADVRGLLESNGLEPAAAAGQGGLLLSRGEEREAHWGHFRDRFRVLQELGVKTLIVSADFAREPSADDLPGEGDFQLEPILDHLGRIGYRGHVSLELFNPRLWQVA